MPGQSRFEKKLRELIAARELVLVVETAVSVSATKSAPATRYARTATWTNWTEDLA